MFRVVSGWYLVYCDKCGNLCNDSGKREDSMDLCGECLSNLRTDCGESEPPSYDENWTPDFL